MLSWDEEMTSFESFYSSGCGPANSATTFTHQKRGYRPACWYFFPVLSPKKYEWLSYRSKLLTYFLAIFTASC